MRNDSGHPDNEDHFLLVRSGGHRCAIPVEAAKLVTKAPKVYPVPTSALRLLGLAQVAGEPVAIVDLHAILDPDGCPGGGHELTVIVRTRGGGSVIGLAIDEAFGVISVGRQPQQSTDDPGWVTGRMTMDGRTVVILDPDQLFVPASAD